MTAEAVAPLPPVQRSEGLSAFCAQPAASARLAPTALDLLRSCKPRQFLWPGGLTPQLRSRFQQPGYVCLYAGNRGVAKEVMKTGIFPWALTFDWLHGPGQDLLTTLCSMPFFLLRKHVASLQQALFPFVLLLALPSLLQCGPASSLRAFRTCLLQWPSKLLKPVLTVHSSFVSLRFSLG